MKLKDKIIFCTALIGVLIWFLYLVNSVLAPFICALIIAYFFNPLVNKLQKFKLSRTTCALIILGIFISVIALIIIFLLPILYEQTLNLFESLPEYYQIFTRKTYPEFVKFMAKFGFKLNDSLIDYFSEKNLDSLLSASDNVLQNVVQSGINIINTLSLIFVTPILIFYLLRDWNLLVMKIDHFLPHKYAPSIRKIFQQIDLALSGYVKGQFNVCLILAILYGTGLSFSHLNFGFLLGFLTGIISFIPYVGMIIGATTTFIMALFQFGFQPLQFAIIATTFLTGQIIESNFLTPRLIGGRINLHPVWIIFGLFVFATLFGFTGILLAVPMSAIIGVIFKFIASEYSKNNK